MTLLFRRARKGKRVLRDEEAKATEVVSVAFLPCPDGDTLLPTGTPRAPHLPRGLGTAEIQPGCTLHVVGFDREP